MSNLKKTAIILCGGQGSRLGNLGKKFPKTLVKIQDQPILWYIINILKKNSFNHFILPIGYRGKMIKDYINLNNIFKNLDIDIVETGIETNIAKRIFLIKNKIKSDNFLLLNGDAIFDYNLKKIFLNHEKKNKDFSLIGCDIQLPYGTVGFVNNKIVSFKRNLTFNSVNIKNKKNFLGYVYSGMSIMNKKLLKLNFKNFKNFEEDLYPKIINNFNCQFESINGFWHSVDNIKDIDATKKKSNNKKYLLIKKIKKKIYDKK